MGTHAPKCYYCHRAIQQLHPRYFPQNSGNTWSFKPPQVPRPLHISRKIETEAQLHSKLVSDNTARPAFPDIGQSERGHEQYGSR